MAADLIISYFCEKKIEREEPTVQGPLSEFVSLVMIHLNTNSNLNTKGHSRQVKGRPLLCLESFIVIVTAILEEPILQLFRFLNFDPGF